MQQSSNVESSQERRQVPPPGSISEPARQVLEAIIPTRLDHPALDDLDGWRKHVVHMNDHIAQMLGLGEDSPLPPGVISAEWEQIAGVPVVRVRLEKMEISATKVVMEIHGGALLYMGGPLVRPWALGRALQMGIETVSVDYRMPPDHPYPAALDDCFAVYRQLMNDYGAPNVAVVGSSAGGNLGAALMLKLKAEGLPVPAALSLLSPEIDLTESGDTFTTLLGLDRLLPQMPANLLYAAGKPLTDPFISPLFGDLSGFPPTFLQSGTRDLFLSNTVRMHRKLRRAGVSADLHIFEAMPHGGFANAPEDQDLAEELRTFLIQHLQS